MMRLSSFKKASILLLTANLSCFFPFCDGATVLPISPMGTDDSYTISVAADDNNNAVTVFENDGFIESRYSPGNQAWEPNVLISDTLSSKGSPEVAMDATSVALAVWTGTDNDAGTQSIETNTLTGGVWGTPQYLEGPAAIDVSAPSVSMNGSGGGVAGWTSGIEIHASFYTAGAWAPFTIVANSYGTVQTAYSANGNAGIAWSQFDLGLNNIYATTSIGTAWQPVTLLDNTGSNYPEIGMDASGNAIVVWGGNFADDIKWSRFDGATWSAGQVLSLASGNRSPKIAVAPDGTAIAVWPDATDTIQLSQFNGTTWSVPAPIASGTTVSITMDSLGNALIGWVTPALELYNALFPLGGALDTPVLVTTAAAPIQERNGALDLALSSVTNVGVAAWTEAFIEGEGNTFATFILFDEDDIPLPPGGITGSVCKNSFAMQSDRVHIITFTPSPDPTVVSYYIYRNGVLVSIVPATGPFTYYDHNRTKGSPDTYAVYAVNGDNNFSTPVVITLD